LGREQNLGKIDSSARRHQMIAMFRVLLPLGWLAAAIGVYGPWIAHPTAALTLSGVDMGEFVKFLPGTLDGSLQVTRQIFYLPPFAIVASIALEIGASQLHYPWYVRLAALLLAVPVSLQLLPPAWSAASLVTPEFRAQTIALGLSWLLLAGFWLWPNLPLWLSCSMSAALALAAAILTSWQYAVVKPAINQVYGTEPGIGWGFTLCMAGLALVAGSSMALALHSRQRSWSNELWSSE
jgi:hypothetical protein